MRVNEGSARQKNLLSPWELLTHLRRQTATEQTVNDDAQLVEATLAGDRNAYGELVERLPATTVQFIVQNCRFERRCL